MCPRAMLESKTTLYTLSCLFFVFYLNDIELTKTGNNSKGIYIYDDNMTLILKLFTLAYADDTVVLSTREIWYAQILNCFIYTNNIIYEKVS